MSEKGREKRDEREKSAKNTSASATPSPLHSRPSSLPLEQMNIVIVGHVDHGKSTVVGRLLADTGSLPEGKDRSGPQRVRAHRQPFEYAFLLDALTDEQDQGITIDTARSFFKTARREYIIIDAPGHIEFLKNMISGAARAEAAVLVIDAKEGVRENSRRHGYIPFDAGDSASRGLREQDGFGQPIRKYVPGHRTGIPGLSQKASALFLRKPLSPASAVNGENLAQKSLQMPVVQGPDALGSAR